MRATILIAFSLTAACYNYEPLTTPSPEVGTFLTVTLTDAGSVELARYLGPSVIEVRGRFLGNSDQGGGLQLAVTSVELVRGDELSWQGESVALPPAAVASVQVRRFARGKSYLLAGGSVAALVVTAGTVTLVGGDSFFGIGGGGSGKK